MIASDRQADILAQATAENRELREMIRKQHAVIETVSATCNAYRDLATTVDRACREIFLALVDARDQLDRGQTASARETIASLTAVAPPEVFHFPEIASMPPLAPWPVEVGSSA